MSEPDRVSERVIASMAAARRQSLLLRVAAALTVVTLTGTVLSFGYAAASAVLPPASGGGVASLIWLPLVVAAGLVALTAGVVLTAIARWR